MAQVTFRIFIPKPIAQKEEGAVFWSLFLRCFSKHVPSRIGNGTNPTTRFDPNDMDLVLKKWNRRDLVFQQEDLLLFGHITRPRRSSGRHVHTEIYVYAFEDDPAAVKNFVYEASTRFGADYATAHILTKEQIRRRLQERVDRAWLTSPKLARKYEENLEKNLQIWPKRSTLGPELGGINVQRGYIKELYWLTVFGPSYVDFFGRHRILAAPAYEVRELPYGGIGVQLTPDVEDSNAPHAWEHFLSVRKQAKSHLDKNAFFEPKLPLTHKYEGPRIQLVNRQKS